MKKIALTCSPGDDMFFLRPRYINVLTRFAREAGFDVLPVVLPIVQDEALIESYANEFDGFICTGGDDIDPSIYGEEKHPKCGEVESARDVFELSLLNKVTALDKPVFGICRGIQIMNVALGGTLWQDIPSQWSEPNGTVHNVRDSENVPRHKVTVSGSLRELLGEDVITTNTYHHQAVKRPGEGLKVCAVNEDGLIEGIEHTELTFYKAVQWHPEMQPDEISRKLFVDFMEHVRG